MSSNAGLAAYPTGPVLSRTLQAIERVNQDLHDWQGAVPDFFSAVRDVVVIASSSRGGSSIFTEILRQSPDLLHCKGEINPMLAIAGLTYPANGRDDDSLEAFDAGPHNRQKLAILERELALDVGVNLPIDLGNRQHKQRFMRDLLWRIMVQWPELELDPDFVLASIEQTFAELVQCHGWESGGFSDPQLFHLLFLVRLRTRYPTINPHYYDLNPERIRRYCPDAEISPSPPGRFVIEEPPFVLIAPRQPVSAATLGQRPLILKTPSNAYRLAFLQQIFPQARFRVLHLVRNPADAINGLVDGWLYHGFFSHPLKNRLQIKGYSDRFPAWGRHWWNYDLPPGWQQWVGLPLEYVCAHQWRAAHQAILDFCGQGPTESRRIAFEDVIGRPELRAQCFADLADWLGISREPLITAALGDLPPVMATAPPRQRRWFKKVALLRPVLEDPAIIETAQRLGYAKIHDFHV